MNDLQTASIGIFDSGFGGLTVMNAVRELLPKENIIYFGDTARLPYGNKSAETILRYAQESALFLLEKKIKLLVIACHTACAFALDVLSEAFSIPVIGVIPPAVDDVVNLSPQTKIAILGTRATISSGVYQEKIRKQLLDAEISAIPCPLFVPLVEEGYVHHPLTEMAVQEYLRPLRDQNIKVALLGCTHYPLLQSLIQKELGEEVTLVNPAISCAKKVFSVLLEKNLLNPNQELPNYLFYVSDDPEKFRLHGKSFLNYPLEHVLLSQKFI
jgi:glutamate racemase